MLYFNFEKIFKLRGISVPYVFLMENGFKRGEAFQISGKRNVQMHLNKLEKLCALLSCTPNDLLAWVPSKVSNLPENHPLYTLKPVETLDIADLTKDVPISKIPEIHKAILEAKAKLDKE